MLSCAVLHLVRLRQTVLVDGIISAAALISVVGAELTHRARFFADFERGYMESGLLDGGKCPRDEPCFEYLPVAAEVSD